MTIYPNLVLSDLCNMSEKSRVPNQAANVLESQVSSLWDWWVMHTLDGKLLSALTYLSGCESEWKMAAQLAERGLALPPDTGTEQRAMIIRSFDLLLEASRRLEMRGIIETAEQAREHCFNLLAVPGPISPHRLRQLVNHVHSVLVPFMNGLMATKLYHMDVAHAGLFAMPEPFGRRVADAFPSAAFDIEEASNCLALSRWTAAVMHLMRASESGLRALARHFQLPASNNWNTTIDGIERALKSVNRREDGAEAEQWASEAAIHFRQVKNAWRNPAMHVQIQYDARRATTIYGTTRDFLVQLAERISE